MDICTGVRLPLYIGLFNHIVQLLLFQRMMNEDEDDGLDDKKENLKQLTRTFSNPGEKEALHRMRSISVKSSDEKQIFDGKVDIFHGWIQNSV